MPEGHPHETPVPEHEVEGAVAVLVDGGDDGGLDRVTPVVAHFEVSHRFVDAGPPTQEHMHFAVPGASSDIERGVTVEIPQHDGVHLG